MTERRSRKRRKITVRVLRSPAEEAQADLEFWQSVSPEQRVAALWDMVLEHRAIKGLEGDEPRLQRSVVRIQRNGR